MDGLTRFAPATPPERLSHCEAPWLKRHVPLSKLEPGKGGRVHETHAHQRYLLRWT